MRRITASVCVISLSLVTSGCFEVIFGVTKTSVQPGDTINVTATIFSQESGLVTVTEPVYLEIPQSWEIEYVEYMWTGGSYSGQTTTAFQRDTGAEYEQRMKLQTGYGVGCFDGENYQEQPYTPRPGYKGYRVQPIGQGFGDSNPRAWAAVMARITVAGEAGDQFTVRAWGGTPDIPGTNVEKCVAFEVQVSIPFFSDGFESGDTTKWSASVP